MLAWSIKIQWPPLDYQPKKCATLLVALHFYPKKNYIYSGVMSNSLSFRNRWIISTSTWFTLSAHEYIVFSSKQQYILMCVLLPCNCFGIDCCHLVECIFHNKLVCRTQKSKFNNVFSYCNGLIVWLVYFFAYRFMFVAYTCFKGTLSHNCTKVWVSHAPGWLFCVCV